MKNKNVSTYYKWNENIWKVKIQLKEKRKYQKSLISWKNYNVTENVSNLFPFEIHYLYVHFHEQILSVRHPVIVNFGSSIASHFDGFLMCLIWHILSFN